MTMASFISSPPPSTTFPQSSKSPTSISGKNDAKPIENPFLVRGTPVARTNQPISKDVGNSGGGPSFSPRSPPALPLVPVNGLRNRKANQKAGSDPPKFSVYLGTGCDYGSTKTDMDENFDPLLRSRVLESSASTSPCGNWILIYGYNNHKQYQALLEKFSSYGRVIKQKKPSALIDPKSLNSPNWLALQYESHLEAEKALCHDHFQLEGGVFCGVKRLSDSDPILMFEGDQEWQTPKLLDSTLIPVEKEELDEVKEDEARVQSVCEQFFRWILAIQ